MITMYDFTILFAILAIAMIVDIREQRIPNILLLCGLVVGLISMCFNFQTMMAVEKVCALFLGIGILFIPFAMGGIGAGDVKLLGVIGFFVGIRSIINISLVSFIVGAIMSLICVLVYRFVTFKSVKAVAYSFMNAAMTKKLLRAEEGKMPIPFSVPIGIATFLVLILKWGVVL